MAITGVSLLRFIDYECNNLFGYDFKEGSKPTYIVNAVAAYTEPEMGHIVIPLINQEIEIKGLDHHLLCPCSKFPRFMAPIPRETLHAIQLENTFDSTHPNYCSYEIKHSH